MSRARKLVTFEPETHKGCSTPNEFLLEHNSSCIVGWRPRARTTDTTSTVYKLLSTFSPVFCELKFLRVLFGWGEGVYFE